MMNIIGKYIEGDMWLSRQTIKGIMTSDLVSTLEVNAAGKASLTVEEYIKDFIQRLDNVEKTIKIKKKWWER